MNKKKNIKIILILVICISLLGLMTQAIASTDKVFIDVASSSNHTIAVKEDGTLWVAGSNDKGQLGLGAGIFSVNEFTQVPGVTNVSFVEAAEGVSIYVTTNGDVFFIGDANTGLAGDEAITGIVYIPVQNGYMSNVSKLELGEAHGIALVGEAPTYSGYYVWGSNEKGQLGLESDITDIDGASFMSEVVRDMSAGDYFTAKIVAGKLFLTGDNSREQLEPISIIGDRYFGWLDKDFSEPFTRVDCGTDFMVLTGDTSSVYTYGNNSIGQLGVGESAKLFDFNKLGNIKSSRIAAEGKNAIVKADDNIVYGFGANANGELGLGHKNSVDTYTKLHFDRNPFVISIGNDSISMIANDGAGIKTFYVSGLNGSNKFGLVDNIPEVKFFSDIQGNIVKIKPTSIDIIVPEMEVAVGDSVAIEYIVGPMIGGVSIANGYSIDWTSGDSNVLTVDNIGNITGKAKSTGIYIDAEIVDNEEGYLELNDRISVNIIEIPALGIDVLPESREITLNVGEKKEILYEVVPENVTNKVVNVTFVGKDPVDASANIEYTNEVGKYPKIHVTGVKQGTENLKICATETICATFVVNVKDDSYVNVFEIISNVEGITLERGKTFDIIGQSEPIYTVLPINANNKAVKFYSGDESIFMVNETTGVIDALGVGFATLTIQTVDVGFETGESYAVTIPVTILPGSGSGNEEIPTTVDIVSGDSAVLKVNDEVKIFAQVMPENAKLKDVTWEVVDKTIVSVTDEPDENGYKVVKIKALKAGTTTLKVVTVADGTSDVMTITVESNPSGGDGTENPVITEPTSIVIGGNDIISMNIGDSRTLTATVYPVADNVNKTVVWNSSNTDVATVTSIGLLKAVGEGNAVITARTYDGKHVDSVSVSVIENEKDKFTFELNYDKDDEEEASGKEDRNYVLYLGSKRKINIKLTGEYKKIDNFTCYTSGNAVKRTVNKPGGDDLEDIHDDFIDELEDLDYIFKDKEYTKIRTKHTSYINSIDRLSLNDEKKYYDNVLKINGEYIEDIEDLGFDDTRYYDDLIEIISDYEDLLYTYIDGISGGVDNYYSCDIEAIREGSSTITVKVNGITETLRVKVEIPNFKNDSNKAPENISLEQINTNDGNIGGEKRQNLKLKVGDTGQVVIKLVPADASNDFVVINGNSFVAESSEAYLGIKYNTGKSIDENSTTYCYNSMRDMYTALLKNIEKINNDKYYTELSRLNLDYINNIKKLAPIYGIKAELILNEYVEELQKVIVDRNYTSTMSNLYIKYSNMLTSYKYKAAFVEPITISNYNAGDKVVAVDIVAKSVGKSTIIVQSKLNPNVRIIADVEVEFDEYDIVPVDGMEKARVDKDLRVDFTMALDKSTINDNTVYVSTDNLGSKAVGGCVVTLLKDKTVVITNSDGWKSGQTYYIIITDKVKAANGMGLSKNLAYKVVMR